MKKIVTVLLLLLAWYFAGMNRQPYVMAAVICGTIFVVLSFFLTRYLKHKLTAEIPEQSSIIRKNMQAEFKIRTDNKCRLPINKYKLTICMNYQGSNRPVIKKLSGNACPAGDPEENLASVYFAAPYCGMISAELRRLRVYDYFMIFSSSSKLRDKKGEVAVLPPIRKMNIRMPAFGSYTNEPVAETSSDKKGEDHSEIRFIREYREGDLTRHIHRNYSARTEKLWVKEYQRENDFIFDLFLDSSYYKETDIEHRDAFYELVYAVVNNLMENDIVIRVHYLDKHRGGAVMFELDSRKDVDRFILDLYKSDCFCTQEEFLNYFNVLAMNNAMLLNASLEWYFCGRPIYRFQKKNIYYELVNRYFDLS